MTVKNIEMFLCSHFYSFLFFFSPFGQKGYLKNNFDSIFTLGQINDFRYKTVGLSQPLCSFTTTWTMSLSGFQWAGRGQPSSKQAWLHFQQRSHTWAGRDRSPRIWEGSSGPCDTNSFLLPSQMIRLQTAVALLCGREVPLLHPSSRFSNRMQSWTKVGRKRRSFQCRRLPAN